MKPRGCENRKENVALRELKALPCPSGIKKTISIEEKGRIFAKFGQRIAKRGAAAQVPHAAVLRLF